MNFAFSEEQQMLRDSVRSFLENKAPSDRVRELMESDAGLDEGLWQEMAEMGWQAMAIPEEYGGAGFSWLELNIINEELGRCLVPTPFFSSVVLGATAVLEGGTEDQKQGLLEKVSMGQHRLALAHIEPSGDWTEAGIETTARPSGSGWVLDGTKSFVVDGHTADTLIVAARTDAGISLFLVPGDAPGVSRQRLETMDMTRKQALIELDAVEVPADGLLGADGAGWDIIDRVMQFAAVALACEQVGGAQKCMEMSVEYAKVRVQFGRPIGSFQAIKHKCADMLLAVESGKSAAYYASWAAAEDNDELPVVSALAKSYCSDAYFDVAAETIQVHGGIGFTWEHDAHLYFKRAKTSQLMLGEPAHYRKRLADLIGL
ncbi:MAG: acyl-CoA/acyl-ACP dehydrogenase [Acidimicrobiia bacterium]|nr:acyl-CoA/acyl-ACP dehydrogenase [Acidimicrobiia bacterium]NNF69792.1 acyl-CoA/acyl-ACP dehydrogenase [Acidimicrobiia bacterium]NNK91748.1 acyl-CoA/acyl-ACP dehydrogenase [Acidimicrobiia bacterium]